MNCNMEHQRWQLKPRNRTSYVTSRLIYAKFGSEKIFCRKLYMNLKLDLHGFTMTAQIWRPKFPVINRLTRNIFRSVLKRRYERIDFSRGKLAQNDTNTGGRVVSIHILKKF